MRSLFCALFCALCAACLREDVELVPKGASESDGAAPPGGCGGQSYRAFGKGLEILVLLDGSASMAVLPSVSLECVLGVAMNCPPLEQVRTLWQVAVSELEGFVYEPKSAGISLALKYFGTDCSPDAYRTPDVVMGALPAQAAAISESLRRTIPIYETATRPALEGALAYMRQRATSPGYVARPVVLLLTDGLPGEEDCSENTTAAVSKVAAGGLALDPPVATYVFVTSPDLELGDVAQAGGTERTIFADFARPGALSTALNAVRDQELAALPCEYALPADYYARVNDPSLVNLNRGGMPVGKVDGLGACSAERGGWYYDDAKTPRRIVTCPSTCGTLKAGGEISIQLDCPTIVLL